MPRIFRFIFFTAAAAALAMLTSAANVEAAKVVLVHGLLGFGPTEIFGKLRGVVQGPLHFVPD